jgi:hypothetical protein
MRLVDPPYDRLRPRPIDALGAAGIDDAYRQRERASPTQALDLILAIWPPADTRLNTPGWAAVHADAARRRRRPSRWCRGGVAGTPLLGLFMLWATWANVHEHAADPTDYWGSRGRRFKSCRPDTENSRSGQVSANGAPALTHSCGIPGRILGEDLGSSLSCLPPPVGNSRSGTATGEAAAIVSQGVEGSRPHAGLAVR